MAVGLAQALHPPRRSGWRGEGLLWLGAGSLLLLRTLGVIEVSLWKLWPILPLVVGARIVWKTVRPAARAGTAESGSIIQATVVLGGVSRNSSSQSFEGGEVTAVLGGCEIDLRQARIASGEAVLEVSAFLGGIEVRVPEDWTVVTRGMPLLGGFEDATHPPSQDTGQRLVVSGFAILGGVEVKN
jgi:predicted membrane protein